MPYFDFHVHPTLKSFFSEDDAANNLKKLNPWVNIDLHNVECLIRNCTDFPFILQSQANLAQLLQEPGSLICVALYMPEKAMTIDKLLNTQANKTKLGVYLQPGRLNKLNTDAIPVYPDLLYEDLEQVLLNPARFGVTDRKIIPLKKGVVYDEHSKDAVYVVFSIEGLHTLLPKLDPVNASKDTILKNLDELTSKYPVVSVNVTHLQQYPFCNHAFGVLFLEINDFIPTHNRIIAEGIDIIQHCYAKNILIDVKHMSLATRRMLIEDIRTRPEFAGILQPLVCTHAGFTGLSYNDIPDYMVCKEIDNPKKCLYIAWGKPRMYSFGDEVIAFNPSSINLYDEDIIAILESGGIIGLNMDKRILGYAWPTEHDTPRIPVEWNDELAFEEEFISLPESDCFLTKPKVGGKITDSICITKAEVSEDMKARSAIMSNHLYHFMAHIVHLIKVAQKNHYDVSKALTQVCIGSDFDGIINPIFECMTMEDGPDFKKDFIIQFPGYAKEHVQLPQNFDIKVFAEQLFFENGKNFVLERLKKIYA